MVRQREAEATRRIDRRSDSKALRGYAVVKRREARKRTSNALCGFARAKVAKMSDGKAKSSWAMAKRRKEMSRRRTAQAMHCEAMPSNGKAKNGKV